MIITEAKKIVLDRWPDAVCKRVGIDNGVSLQPFYVVFKCNSTITLNAISSPCKKSKEAWISAATQILNQEKDKV